MTVAYVNSGTLTHSSTNITPPLPASLVTGNMLLAMVISYSASSPTYTWPGGWTVVDTQSFGTGTYEASFAYRIVNGSDTAPAITVTNPGDSTAQVFQISGTNASPIGAHNAATGIGATHTSPAITTTANNSDVFYLDLANAGTFTTPSGWTSDSSSGDGYFTLSIGDKQVATSGSSSGAISTSGGSGFVQWQVEILLAGPTVGAVLTTPFPVLAATVQHIGALLTVPAIYTVAPTKSATLTVPFISATAAIDGGFNKTVPFISIAASANANGPYAILSVPMPTLVVKSLYVSANLTVPAPSIVASINEDFVGTVPMISITASSDLAAAVLTLPALRILAGIDGGVSKTLPMPTLLAVLFGPTDVATTENPYGQSFPGWAINMETNAPSRYDEVPANSLCQFNGVTYLSCAGGIYALDGGNDAGRSINAYFMTSQSDFEDAHNKRVFAVYSGLKATGTMLLKAIANSGEGRYYALTGPGGAVQGSRATLGKGLEGRYWQFRVENQNGCDFEADALEFKPEILKRRGV